MTQARRNFRRFGRPRNQQNKKIIINNDKNSFVLPIIYVNFCKQIQDLLLLS